MCLLCLDGGRCFRSEPGLSVFKLDSAGSGHGEVLGIYLGLVGE